MSPDTRNLLLDPLPVEYAVEETHLGTWRRHVDPKGNRFAEYVSHAKLGPLPMVHVVRGRDPATLTQPTAVGVIAIGQWARGLVAIGQAAVGLVAIGQLACGILFGLGQLATGVLAIGQLAVGFVAVGQMAAGVYALGMGTSAAHGWDMSHTDPAAEQFFRRFTPF